MRRKAPSYIGWKWSKRLRIWSIEKEIIVTLADEIREEIDKEIIEKVKTWKDAN